jgi:hypothetical protein
MLRKTADYSVRTILLMSMTFYGVAPAAASIIPQTALPATEAKSPADMPELEALLAAFKSEPPSRQSVDHPSQPDKGRQNTSSQTSDKDRSRLETPLSRYMTRKIVLDLAAIRKECGAYDEVYRIDCLRQGIDMVVASLPDDSEYREAKQILRKASSRLGRIVSTYQDRSAPKLEAPADANPRFKKRRKYTAIKREAVPTAMAKATYVVNEATTQLLRSGENSERRYAHYQDISVAVDSTKALLRSG